MTVIFIIMIALSTNGLVLFDFSKNGNTENWQVVNDGVMGGLSEATFEPSNQGSAIFKGRISLENNGGF